MSEHNIFKEETLQIIREVEGNPSVNQRILSRKLNVSLGKINYLIRELIMKGAIKIAGFSTNPEKGKRLRYILTQKGMEEKVSLTFHFLKAKEREYRELKEEYEKYRTTQLK